MNDSRYEAVLAAIVASINAPISSERFAHAAEAQRLLVAIQRRTRP